MERSPWTGYGVAAGAAVAATLAGLAIHPPVGLANVALVYLLAVVVVALRQSRGPSALAATLCVLAFDFCFVPPRWTFTVDDPQYLLTFALMLAVALVVSGLGESERRHAASRQRLAIEAEAERIRGTLLASISHDLRTPLAVIAGASSTLAERGERMAPDQRAALARDVFARAASMSEHVEKILQMTRLESGGLAPARDWASPSEIAGSALARVGSRLAEHRVLVELPEELPLVRVDAALVEQALVNLLENAGRHTPPGTVVRLRAARAEGELVMTVEDYGGGLPEGAEDAVFAKFARGTAEGTGGGTGLGLSIVRSIVRLHGGRAWAERVSGGGTAFHFSLPVEAAPAMPVEGS